MNLELTDYEILALGLQVVIMPSIFTWVLGSHPSTQAK